jgi:hypothetical protein
MIAPIITLWYATTYVMAVGILWPYIAIIKTEYSFTANKIDKDTRNRTIKECFLVFFFVFGLLGPFFFLFTSLVTIFTLAGYIK